MGQLLAMVLEAIGISQAVRSLLLALGIVADKTAEDAHLAVIEATAADLHSYNAEQELRWPEGVAHAMFDYIAARFTDIDDAIALLTPVTLPATPPSGWGAPTAEAVWDYQDPAGDGVSQSTFQIAAGSLSGKYTMAGAMPISASPGFALTGAFDSPYYQTGVDNRPDPDYADIRPDDTRLTWLQRTDLLNTWEAGLNGSPIALAHPSDPGTSMAMEPIFTEADFVLWRDNLSRPRAPIWPGLDHVTLGTPVALGPDVSIEATFDGILTDVTTPPTGLGKFIISGVPYYYRMGQIAFVDDHGTIEQWQYLGWGLGLYCPKAIAHPASCLIRALAGVEGTATPWLAT